MHEPALPWLGQRTPAPVTERRRFCSQAALALRKQALELGMVAGVAVDSGSVWLGMVGGATARVPLLRGDAVRRAHCLARLAGSSVLVSDAVALPASMASAFARVPVQCVDGSFAANLTSAMALLPDEKLAAICAAGQWMRPRPMVGREREKREVLRRATCVLSDEHGAIIGVEGGTGSGKSLLVTNVACELQLIGDRAMRVVPAAASAAMSRCSFSALRLVLQALFHLGGVRSRQQCGAVFMETLQAQAGASVRTDAKARQLWHLVISELALIGDLLGCDFDQSAGTSGRSPEVSAGKPLRPASWQSVAEVTLQLLRLYLGSRPCIFILDNAHFVDQASGRVMAEWVRVLWDKLPFVMICIVDTGESCRLSSSILQKLQANSRWARVSLDQMTDAECVQVALPNLGQPAPGVNKDSVTKMVDFIGAKSQGDPYLAKMIAVWLRLKGYAATAGEACPGGDLDKCGMPAQLPALLRVLIDQLSPKEQNALKFSCVLGHVVPFNLLQSAPFTWAREARELVGA